MGLYSSSLQGLSWPARRGKDRPENPVLGLTSWPPPNRPTVFHSCPPTPLESRRWLAGGVCGLGAGPHGFSAIILRDHGGRGSGVVVVEPGRCSRLYLQGKSKCQYDSGLPSTHRECLMPAGKIGLNAHTEHGASSSLIKGHSREGDTCASLGSGDQGRLPRGRGFIIKG